MATNRDELEAKLYTMGQQVKIRSDLSTSMNNVADNMLQYAGKVVTIDYIGRRVYNFEELPYNWSDHMLEPVSYDENELFERYLRGELNEKQYTNLQKYVVKDGES